MPDEDDVVQVECLDDVDDVGGVPLQGGVLLRVVGGEVRAARADVVEGDDAMTFGERWRDVAPHGLVTPEPVREQHRLSVLHPGRHDVVPCEGSMAPDSIRPARTGCAITR